MVRAAHPGAPQRVSAHVLPKGHGGASSDEEERTTIEAAWEEEPSTTVEQGEAAEHRARARLHRRRQAHAQQGGEVAHMGLQVERADRAEEGEAVGRFLGRAVAAGARRDVEGAEADRPADRHLQRRGAAEDFVEGLEDGDLGRTARFDGEGVLEVLSAEDQWVPIRAAVRYVTQRPWNRIPPLARTAILNPVIACLAGGRNKLLAAKALA